jgi:hypothetical protein
MSLCLESLLVQLDESKSWIFEEVFRVFSLEELQQALDAAFAVEQSGGELVADQKRMRTVGGIFLRVLKEQHPERTARILKEQTAMRRKEAAARAQRFVKSQCPPVPDIQCPAEVVGQIIGKCGTVINKFRRDSGCRITLNAKRGTIRVEGQEDRARKCRAQLQEEVSKAIRNTHGEYYDQVLMSDFMCKKANTQEPWAAMLKQWVQEAVENSACCAMQRVLAELVAKAPKDTVAEISERLTAAPELFDSVLVRDAVLFAIQHPQLPQQRAAGFDPAALLAAGYEPDDEAVWIAPDGERFTKAKFLEEVGDEELWLSELQAQSDQEAASTATPCEATSSATGDEAMTPPQDVRRRRSSRRPRPRAPPSRTRSRSSRRRR